MTYSLDRHRLFRGAVYVALLATLAACMRDGPTGPVERRALPSARTIDFASADFTISRRDLAYVFANQPSTDLYTPDDALMYNSHGGAIHVSRFGRGRYSVFIDGAFSAWPAYQLGYAVSAVGWSGITCRIAGHNIQSSILFVTVGCYNRMTNEEADAAFTLLVVGKGLSGRHGFARTTPGNYPSYMLDTLNAWSTANLSSAMTGTYNATVGDVTVDLATGATAGTTALVSDWASIVAADAGLCKLAEWKPSKLRVICFGADGQPKDIPAYLLQLERSIPGRQLGFAFANQLSTASYTPDADHSYNSAGGDITVTRLATGRYYVDFSGLHRDEGEPMTAQVSTFGTARSRCGLLGWINTASGVRVAVECRNASEALTDSRFNVLVIQ